MLDVKRDGLVRATQLADLLNQIEEEALEALNPILSHLAGLQKQIDNQERRIKTLAAEIETERRLRLAMRRA